MGENPAAFARRGDQWERIQDLPPGSKDWVGVTGQDNRLFVEAVLYRYRSGIPWRDLLERFGHYRKIHTRFRRPRPPAAIPTDTVLADKGYDADKRVIEPLKAQGKTAVIPLKRNRKTPREYDRDLCKARHWIENFFAKPKQYRAMATRYDKLVETFLSAIYMAAWGIWLI